MQQEAETWAVHSQALVFGWIWVRVTKPVGWPWAVWMRSFRALQTSHQRSMTQRPRNHLKPSEQELNHQETGPCLQKVPGPPNSTKPQPPLPPGDILFSTGGHYPRNVPVCSSLLSHGFHNSSFHGGRTLFCIILLFKLRTCSWMCGVAQREHKG